MTCQECGGFAKAKEEVCSLCDGEGNLKTTKKEAKPTKKK